MNFLLTSELIEFRDLLRKFLADKFSAESRRKNLLVNENTKVAPRFDTALWKELAELGVFSAPMDENCGGLGFGARALQVILEESARRLLQLPLFETLVLGAIPIRQLATETNAVELLSAIADSSLRVSSSQTVWHHLACSDVLSEQAKAMQAKGAGEKWVLTGTLVFVPAYSQVNAIVVPVLKKSGKSFECALFLFETGTKGILESPLESLDLVRQYSNLTLKNVTARMLSDGWFALERLKDVALQIEVGVAAELAGVAAEGLEMTVEYVKVREQFGKPIGTFQAIQHKLADMCLWSEQVCALGRFAAHAIEVDKGQFTGSAIAAKSLAAELVPKVMESAIQAHGGIGFTFEYDLHLYLRRARALAALGLGRSEGYLALAEARINGV